MKEVSAGAEIQPRLKIQACFELMGLEFSAQPNRLTKTHLIIACEQAHLVCNSHEYLGGGSRRVKPREDTRANYALSEPARRLI